MSSNGVLTVNWNSTNFNSATGTSTIDCSAWLEEERRKVWATAAASSGRVGSSNTIRYPSSTYGSFNTITATANATASLGGHGQDCDVRYSASGEAWHDIDSYDTHYAYVSSTSVSWS